MRSSLGSSDYDLVDGQATASNSSRLTKDACPKCENRKSFCSCNSQLNYDPIERWRNQSKSPSNKSFNKKLNKLEKFCIFVDKNIFELLSIAQQHQHQGDVQVELEEYLTQYLDSLAPKNIAKSTVGKDASRIISFFSICNVPVLVPRRLTGTDPQYEKGEHKRALTQLEVHKMVQAAETTFEKLVICLISQLGQRIGVLTALKYDMIQPMSDGWGYVEINGDYLDYQGKPVGLKVKAHYCFLVHPESMTLIRKWREEQEPKFQFIFTMDVRQIQDIFYRAAKKAGVQRKYEIARLTKGGKHQVKNEVHPHILRAFFETQMLEGHATEGLPPRIANYFIDFLMGHKGPAFYTYLRGIVVDEKLLAAYKRAEDKLRVISN